MILDHDRDALVRDLARRISEAERLTTALAVEIDDLCRTGHDPGAVQDRLLDEIGALSVLRQQHWLLRGMGQHRDEGAEAAVHAAAQTSGGQDAPDVERIWADLDHLLGVLRQACNPQRQAAREAKRRT